MKIKAISSMLIGGVIIVVIGYVGLLLFITWSVTELSINKAGVFGDSFGVLTSLFSGSAFSGMIITILLQREELKLQRQELKENRIEFAKSANAQENNSKLSALSALLSEYKSQIDNNQNIIEADALNVNPYIQEKEHLLLAENKVLNHRKEIIIVKIEEILEGTGIKLVIT